MNLFIRFFSIFHCFYPITNPEEQIVSFYQIINIFFFSFILGTFIYWLWRIRSASFYKPLAFTAAFYIIAYLLGPEFFGGMVKPYERFLYPILWLIVTCLVPVVGSQLSARILRVIQLCLFALVILQFSIINTQVKDISTKMDATYTTLDSILKRDFCVIDLANFNFQDKFPQPDITIAGKAVFASWHIPLYRVFYYICIEKDISAPVFPTGILKETKNIHWPASVYNAKKLPQRFHQIIIIGDYKSKNFVSNLFGKLYHPIFKNEYLTILEKM